MRRDGAEVSEIWSRRLESNQRPAVYETAALPTELRRRGIIATNRGGRKRRYDSEDIAGVSILAFVHLVHLLIHERGTPADFDPAEMEGTQMGC
jgi:hypothetical protein